MAGAARRIAGITLVLAALVGPVAVAPAGRGDLLPYAVEVRLSYGPVAGPRSFLEELKFHVVESLRDARCFEAVRAATPESASSADLVLDVRLDDFREETTFELGVAARQSGDLPPDARNRALATLGADFTLRLLTVPRQAEIRVRRSALSGSYRPVLSEDASDGARARLLESAARSITGFACKGSPKALARAIARAEAVAR